MEKYELKSVSASKLRLYLQCAKRYYYAYYEGMFQEETKATRFGSYIHSVLEDYLKCLLKNRKEQDIEALYEIANARKTEYQEITETGDHSFFESDIILNKFASKKIDPELIYTIEKFFKIPFFNDNKIAIEGRIDRIDITNNTDSDNLLHIIDYKTGKNKLTEEELTQDLQMQFYVAASYLLYKKTYSKFEFSHYYLLDNTKVSVCPEHPDSYIQNLTTHIEKMKNDTSFEKVTGTHCRFCPALKTCKPDMSKTKK